MIGLLARNVLFSHSRIKRCTVSFVHHEQKVARCTALHPGGAELPVVFVVRRRGVVFSDLFIDFVFDQTRGVGFEDSCRFRINSDSNVVASDSLLCSLRTEGT